MTSMQRWTATSAFAMALIPMAFADPPAPPLGVTGTYETATAPVQSIYTVTEGSHRFVAYVVEWKGAPVVVSDALALSDYKMGDTITFMAHKTTIDKPGQEVASLSFILLEAAPHNRHSNEGKP